jgi:L-lysine exporter family protein LysE/ArgO
MFHQFFFGLLLGWGAAIPIGPINLEIIRRNLRMGTSYGIALGIGACTADVTYLLLLSLGALAILTHVAVMNVVNVVGSLILAWFGYSALRMQVSTSAEDKPKNNYPVWRHAVEGYFLTLINPGTILFWASVSAQVATISHQHVNSPLYAGVGVALGTFSWILSLNGFLHVTRHRLSPRMTHYLNCAGGVILLGFAAFGLGRVLF